MNSAIEFKDVDILFAREPGRDGRKAIREALVALDAGGTRAAISEKYGVIVGVAGASLNVARGEISVLMGLSGSGKSTLLRAANGLNPVVRGQVLVRDGDSVIDVANCDVPQMRRLRRERVAMVFQQFGLLPWRTVRENVGFGLELRGEPAAAQRRIVDEKLELVGLSQWSERYVSELSGGMQQRVGLARAFATDADILLMDEPFSALDPLIRDKLQDELLLLQKDLQKTIIFVSHDLDEAMKLGNRIAILEGGRIVQCGRAEEILLTPANDYVAEFVKHMNPLNVLRGGALMTPAAALARSGAEVMLDKRGRIRLQLDDENRPLSCTLDGHAGSLAAAAAADTHSDILVAPVDLKMRLAIELRRRSGNPIVLVDELGRLAGLCGDDEIYRALLQARRAEGVG